MKFVELEVGKKFITLPFGKRSAVMEKTSSACAKPVNEELWKTMLAGDEPIISPEHEVQEVLI